MHWEILSPVIIVGTAFAFIGLERLFPYDRGQKLIRTQFWSDLFFYGFAQSYVLGLAIDGIVRYIDGKTGLSALHLVADWPVPLQLFFFFVTHDFYIYCFHRAQHRFDILWRIHEAHHAPDAVDWLADVRSHPLEILINQTIEFAPIALLGGAPEVALMKATLDAVWGMYIHSNLGVRTGLLQRVINGPEMHRWHHALDIPAPGKNFSTKLAIWDWLFGTAHLPEGRKPSGYGIDVPFPSNYLVQILWAFRPPGHQLKSSPENALAAAAHVGFADRADPG
jgi:sterol desaturase/sphingolipid hydroxylase (fatty acid hydroxylase superfamily)